jgi:hypothetical protein
MLENNDKEITIADIPKKLEKRGWKNTGQKKETLINKRFGKLVVLSKEGVTKWRASLWRCKCDCGKEKLVRGRLLIVGETKSCGCLHSTGYEEISGTYIGQVKSNARRRGLEYNLSHEYIWNLYIVQNKKCVISGVDIKFGNNYKGIEFTASLDRIDSSKGYIEGNVRWLHKTVNLLKSNYSDEEFLKWVNIIYNYKNSTSI